MKSRKPGRPVGSGSSDVRGRLLGAAREICIESGFDAATIKRIAARAGVNAAMIKYYFGNKEGLGQAMMRDAIAPLAKRLDQAARDLDQITVERFIRLYIHTVAANPWLPRLIVREVLPVNGRFREMFLDEFAGRAAQLLEQMLRREQRSRRIRSDVDPRFALLSLISLAIFPFLAAPIVEPILELQLSDEVFVNRLIDHSVSMFRRGLGTEGVL